MADLRHAEHSGWQAHEQTFRVGGDLSRASSRSPLDKASTLSDKKLDEHSPPLPHDAQAVTQSATAAKSPAFVTRTSLASISSQLPCFYPVRAECTKSMIVTYTILSLLLACFFLVVVNACAPLRCIRDCMCRCIACCGRECCCFSASSSEKTANEISCSNVFTFILGLLASGVFLFLFVGHDALRRSGVFLPMSYNNLLCS